MYSSSPSFQLTALSGQFPLLSLLLMLMSCNVIKVLHKSLSKQSTIHEKFRYTQDVDNFAKLSNEILATGNKVITVLSSAINHHSHKFIFFSFLNVLYS